ncbi:MAG: hypothetical protein JJV95_00235 [Sulfurospirillum sp.]|nr:hypothetical protein [Sulfurospirillum sp.]MBL0702395.1 hypothetical protein [Sulfurospirillum sp.]
MIYEKLKQDNILLKKQLSWLKISTCQCKKITIKKEYTVEEFGNFETLCSRYSRSMDFLIRKIFRTLDEFEFENQGTLVDVINNAHKRELFEDIEMLRVMKDLRNTIVHEYIEDELIDVFEEVLKYSEILIEIINNTLYYIKNIISKF